MSNMKANPTQPKTNSKNNSKRKLSMSAGVSSKAKQSTPSRCTNLSLTLSENGKRQFNDAAEMYEYLREISYDQDQNDFTVNNFIGVIPRAQLENMTVIPADTIPKNQNGAGQPIWTKEVLRHYSDKNMGKDVSENNSKYVLEYRGGTKGDYSFHAAEKIQNIINCFKEGNEFSKRAHFNTLKLEEGQFFTPYTADGQTKCLRELYFYNESKDGKKGVLGCTGLLRMQNADIYPKNIHFIGSLMEYVADKLEWDVGSYTHIIINLCFNRLVDHC